MQNRPKQNDPRRAKLWELREQRERTLVKIAYDEMNQEEKKRMKTIYVKSKQKSKASIMP